MGQVIVYQPPGLPAAVMIPSKCDLTLEEIGRKDVPAGLPFWIVEESSLPQDRTFRNAWDLNIAEMGERAGIGGTYQQKNQGASE